MGLLKIVMKIQRISFISDSRRVKMTTDSNLLCITYNEPDAKSHSNPNPISTTKLHTVVNIQLNIVTCCTYPEKSIQDNVVALLLRLYAVTVTLSEVATVDYVFRCLAVFMSISKYTYIW